MHRKHFTAVLVLALAAAGCERSSTPGSLTAPGASPLGEGSGSDAVGTQRSRGLPAPDLAHVTALALTPSLPGDGRLVEPPAPGAGTTGASGPVAGAAAVGPAGGFPVVFVRSGAGTDNSTEAGAPVVDDLADAIARVAEGGTIRIFEGTYPAAGLDLDKAVTIEPQSGPVTLVHDGTDPLVMFLIDGQHSGTVTFRGLRFVTEARFAIVAQHPHYEHVVVEDCEFEMGPASVASLGFGWSEGASRAVVRGSRFTGGARGVFALGDPGDPATTGHVRVEGSAFEGHRCCGFFLTNFAEGEFLRNRVADAGYSGIQVQAGAEARVEDNVLTECGSFGCIRVGAAGPTEVVGNRIEVRNGREGNFGPIQFGIAAFTFGPWPTPEHLIRDNEVVGVGGSGTDFVFEAAGIELFGGVTFRLLDNRVTDAQHGIRISTEAGGEARGNEVTDCGFACVAVGADAGAVTLAENVFTTEKSRHTSFGVLGGGPGAGPLTIVANELNGLGVPSDPTDFGAYTWEASAVQINASPAPTVVSRNVVRNAHQGIFALGGHVTGLDNVLTLNHQPLKVGGGGSLDIHSSDVTDYQIAVNFGDPATGTADLTCNWWGTAAGPVNPDPAFAASVYTPWATSPVAGTSTTTCSGGI